MFFGSFRKYFFTLEEIITRSMGYVSYGVISIYVWYNNIEIYKSIEMIVDSAMLVPSFYTPLQELCYLIYYISEGNNALNRLAKLMQITRSKRPDSKECVVIDRRDCLSVFPDTTHFGSALPQKIELKFGVPVILSCNDVTYGHLPTDLLKRVIFGVNSKDGVTLELSEDIETSEKSVESLGSKEDNNFEKKSRKLEVLSEVENPICYVPLDSWITDGMSLADIILNGRSYDAESWDRVIDSCELKNDFLTWGITDFELAKSTIFSQVQFSRGQKTRLALSRAIYGIGSSFGSLQSDFGSDSVVGLAPILLLDSIFASLDPPICCSILSKLFNKNNGLLKSAFSIVVLDTQMLTFLPVDILNSSVHVLPSNLQLSNSKPRNKTPKSTTGNATTTTSESINSIISDFCFESDFSRDLWELSTNEDELFNTNDSDGETSGPQEDKETNFIKPNSGHSETPLDSGKVSGRASGVRKTNIEHDLEDTKFEVENGSMVQKTQPEEEREEYSELLPKKKEATSSENTYSTLLFYILKAANKFKYPKNWDTSSKVRESSLGMFLYLAFLLLPQFILVFGEKVLLGNLAINKELNDLNRLTVDILYFTYFFCILSAILFVVISGVLEVFVGLRAASNIHNSFFLGYISSRLSSCIRYLPVSFILNRLSLDQLTIDYCTTKRVGQFATAINRIMAAIYLSIMASNYPLIQVLLFVLFVYVLYKYVLRYFIHSCRLLHNTYISEISLLVDTVRNVCDGKECIQPQKLDKFYLDNGYEQLQEIMRPIYIQSSLETWLKIRLQVGIIIPVTFLNIFSSYFSSKSSKILIALVIATTYSSLPRIDEVVRYLMRLERELVSVERMRKYLELIKEEHIAMNIQKSNLDCNVHKVNDRSVSINEVNNNLVLESVNGYHSNISVENERSQLDRSEVRGTLVKKVCCLRNINAVAKKGDVIGIVGRSGSGKTSLLYLIANSLEYRGRIIHAFGTQNMSDEMNNGHFSPVSSHIVNCNLCRSNTDEQIMKIFLHNCNDMRNIAMLPVEVFFNENVTIRSSVDPFNRFTDENVISALNICGISDFLMKMEHMKERSEEGSEEKRRLLEDGKSYKKVERFLDRKIGELSLPMQIQRMLLFTHYFLKRNEINILLIDEPPVIYEYQGSIATNSSSRKKKSTLITNIIFKYFTHSITFIVAHDIRNLNNIRKFWYLNQGNLIIKKL
ncbi:ABC transporter [Cryptosporidium felis]|nr:ABC transporter [Cryptosporidium felis]